MEGGKTSSAHYFIATVNNDHLIYLDPHTTQPAYTEKDDIKKNFQTYFTDKLRILEGRTIGTSVGFGFYLHNLFQFDEFYADLEKIYTSA